MSTKVNGTEMGIRDSGNTQGDVKTQVVTLSDGSAVAVYIDPSSAGATNGSHDGTFRIRLYHSSDRVTWTQKASLSIAAFNNTSGWSIGIFPDNSVAVIWTEISGAQYAVKYCKFAWAAGPTYTAGSVETVQALTTDVRWQCLNMSISDTSVPVVMAISTATGSPAEGRRRIWTRRTSDSTWVATSNVSLSTNIYPNFNDCAILLLGGTGTARNGVMAVQYAVNANGTSNDAGVLVYTFTLNESTGGFSALTLQETYSANFCGVSTGITWSITPRRVYLFRSATDEYTGAYVQMSSTSTSSTRWVFGFKASWVSSTYTEIVTSSFIGTMTSVTGQSAIAFQNGMLVTMHSVDDGTGKLQIRHTLAKMGSTQYTTAHLYWDNTGGASASEDSTGISGGAGDRNVTADMAFYKTTTGDYEFRHHYVKPTRAPAAVRPLAGSTVSTSEPSLSADADIDLKYPQSQHGIKWQFATDSGFTTNVRTYTETFDKFVIVENTDVAGTVVTINDTLPTALSLTQTVWYMRAAHIDEFGVAGAWTAGQSFTVSHPPSDSGVAPSSGQVVIYGSGSIRFDWNFSDPYPADSQTAFQVVIERVSDGVALYASAKTFSSDSEFISPVLGAGIKDVQIRWKVRSWDEDDVAGAFSTPLLFLIVDPPTVAIGAPTSGGVVASGLVNTTFTPTVGGTRTITNYRVIATQGELIKHDTGWVTLGTPVASGTPMNYTSPSTVFSNNQNYTITVYVRDSIGMEANSSVSFSTSWTPPAGAAGLAVSAANYNVEGAGYVSVAWNDTARDVDFYSWVVYRKDDEINPTTLAVVEAGTWTQIHEQFETMTNYTYFDYQAPSSKKVSYRVKQKVVRFGDTVESENTDSQYVIPPTDGYWLIEPSTISTTQAIRLSIVISDSYDDEYDESELVIAGRGRYIDRGDHLGVKGTMTAQFRNTNGTTARQKKRSLEAIKTENRNLYLRTPFGDVYRVSVRNLGISRIAGVSLNEFVDVTIPYAEVGE